MRHDTDTVKHDGRYFLVWPSGLVLAVYAIPSGGLHELEFLGGRQSKRIQRKLRALQWTVVAPFEKAKGR